MKRLDDIQKKLKVYSEAQRHLQNKELEYFQKMGKELERMMGGRGTKPLSRPGSPIRKTRSKPI